MGPKGTTELVATISLEPEPSLVCAISASSGRRKARCALRLSPRSSRALLSRLGSSAPICYTGFCSDAPHSARSCCQLRPAAGFLRSWSARSLPAPPPPARHNCGIPPSDFCMVPHIPTLLALTIATTPTSFAPPLPDPTDERLLAILRYMHEERTPLHTLHWAAAPRPKPGALLAFRNKRLSKDTPPLLTTPTTGQTASRLVGRSRTAAC